MPWEFPGSLQIPSRLIMISYHDSRITGFRHDTGGLWRHRPYAHPVTDRPVTASQPTMAYTRTKLHRPPVPDDYVSRPRLTAILNRYPKRVLTLVCAPPGYGKSTLLSHWLSSCRCPTAWVSLDEDDNEPRSFLTCFLAALRDIVPTALDGSWEMAHAPELPPMPTLLRCLVNELDHIEIPLIVVIDDYHVIHDKAVHGLLAGLLKHPVPGVHLALGTRRDPPLPLTSLRARGRMGEIRARELRFSVSETAAFFRQTLKVPVDRALAEVLEEKTEGWVTALRLSALSLRGQTDPGQMIRRLRENRYVMDYLVSEVLANQPPELREFLLNTAILERFCAPLCDVLCMPSRDASCAMDGRMFIDAVERANLFVVSLDSRREWYRYHHLFRQLLLRQLKRRSEKGFVLDLHRRAARWLERNGEAVEAHRHLLAASGPGGHGDTVSLAKPLTARELEILEQMQAGFRNKEIAERLFISPETVKRHVANIYKKFGTNSRQQTLNEAHRLGILAHRA